MKFIDLFWVFEIWKSVLKQILGPLAVIVHKSHKLKYVMAKTYYGVSMEEIASDPYRKGLFAYDVSQNRVVANPPFDQQKSEVCLPPYPH